jgi:(S)-sulfolactate dehydrogenase
VKKILITEFMDEPAVASLRGRFEVEYTPTLAADRAALLRAVPQADGLIVRNRTKVDREVLGQATRVRVVGRLGVGLDNIDVGACAERGIQVIPATGANALSVAEYVVCAAMMLLRGAYLSSAAVADGRWPREALSGGRELAGRTLGIVGFGLIGRTVGRLARALGMEVFAFDAALAPSDDTWAVHGASCVSLDVLLGTSDVVTLHVPLTPQTRHLIDGKRIALMKPDAILINTARGGIVDEAALAAALRAGRLGGAALDVFDQEPLAAGSPLAGAPNLLLTPHIAGLTRESNERVSGMIAERVAAALSPPA